jgi:hypothetical protein
VLLVGVVALSVVGAAATLYALGWLLHKVLVAFPRWIGVGVLADQPALGRPGPVGDKDPLEANALPTRLVFLERT